MSARAPELSVVKQTQALTDQSAAVVKSELNQVNDSFSAQTRLEASTALNALADLTLLREAATSTQLPAQVVVMKYATIIEDLTALIDLTGQGASDAALAQSIRVLGLVSRMQEEASEQRADLSMGLLQGSLSPNELSALNSAIAQQASNLASFNTTASIAQRQVWNNSVLLVLPLRGQLRGNPGDRHRPGNSWREAGERQLQRG